MRVYVASSWRNERQPGMVQALRAAGHEVYDFRHPKPGDNGFHWSEIDPEWEGWMPEELRSALRHPIAERGFRSDMRALRWAEAVVLLLPCGRSAHLEFGWALGRRKLGLIFAFPGDHVEPELMYLMSKTFCTKMDDLLWILRVEENAKRGTA